MALPQGLHAPFVTTAALVIFGVAQIAHASGFLAVYLAGIIIGNRPTRAHNSVVTFLDAATWLAQIVMFVLLGLLVVAAAPAGAASVPAVIVALVLMLVARPLAVFAVPGAVPVQLAGKGLHRLDRPARRGRDLPGLDPDAGRAVEGLSLFRRRLRRRRHLAAAAGLDAGRRRRGGCTWRCRAPTAAPRRVELDLPGQLEQQLVGYPVRAEKPVFPARPDSVLVEADAGDPRRAHSLAGRGRSGRGRATTSICWRRRKRPRRWIASLSTCRRARRPIRICSATSWYRASITLGELAADLRRNGRRRSRRS